MHIAYISEAYTASICSTCTAYIYIYIYAKTPRSLPVGVSDAIAPGADIYIYMRYVRCICLLYMPDIRMLYVGMWAVGMLFTGFTGSMLPIAWI
jgi:hypothetical protein